MVYCAVVGCSSNNNKKSKDLSNSKFRYFTFPSSKEICDTWVKNCCQKNKFNVQTARVCSRHFSEDDFQMKEKLLKLPFVKWKLKPDAVPSLNIPNPLNEQTSTQKILEERPVIKNICVNIQGHDSLELASNREAIPMKMDNAGGTTVTETQSASTSRTTATQTISSYEQTGLLEKIRVLEEKIRVLEEQNRSLAQQLRKEKDERMSVEQIFTTGQLRKLKSKKQIHWGSDDVASAISLYAGGPRSYRLLKKRGYPLPSVSTLRRWASKINMQPGILNIVLTLMKNTELTRMERSCILLFDEMKIYYCYEYDKKSDTTLAPSKYVQVVMARGICSNWKQPIFYAYDCKITKSLLFKLIGKLEAIGYPVYAINCDLGSSNRGLWNSLNISQGTTYFRIPVNDKRVHVFADAPHMIKLFRNHFLDSGYILNEKMITTKPLVELLQKTQLSDLNIAHKLNSEMLTVKGAQRQKVKLATKLFSHTISRAVSRLGMLGMYQADNNWAECAELLKTVNDWFDIFNSQIPCRDSRSSIKAYGLALEEQNIILDDMKNMTEQMRKIGFNALLPFQKGIIISIESLKQLFIDMKEDFKISYILTHHLNQDPLEGLFSILRAIGGLHDHPTALQFKYRLRNYLMGRNDEIISESANVSLAQEQPSQNLLAEGSMCALSNPNISSEQDTDKAVTGQMFGALHEDSEVAAESEDVGGLEELHWDGLENLAGFIAFKLRKSENLGYIPDCQDTSFSWTNHLSEGGLQKPTEDFLTKCNELDHIFNNFNGDGVKIQENYLKKLKELSQNVALSDEAKSLFFRCKMYFRIRILNKNINTMANTGKRKMNKILK